MIIAKKILFGGVMAAFLVCRAHNEDFSTRQKAVAGTSFVVVGMFSGYLAYTRNQVNSWLTTVASLLFSAPCAAVGGSMLADAFAEIADQNIINEAYNAHCLAIRRYKVIIDHWVSGKTSFSDLAPLITTPIDSYLFSLKKMICVLHEQEDILKARLLHSFDNMHAQRILNQLLYNIVETHLLLEQINVMLNENTVYFTENLGEDAILEIAVGADNQAIEESAEEDAQVEVNVIVSELSMPSEDIVAQEVQYDSAIESLQEAETPVEESAEELVVTAEYADQPEQVSNAQNEEAIPEIELIFVSENQEAAV